LHRRHRYHVGCGCGHGFMSVEQEIEMLERAREHLQAQMKNVDERLARLKA
jgi:hypothetical protein